VEVEQDDDEQQDREEEDGDDSGDDGGDNDNNGDGDDDMDDENVDDKEEEEEEKEEAPSQAAPPLPRQQPIQNVNATLYPSNRPFVPAFETAMVRSFIALATEWHRLGLSRFIDESHTHWLNKFKSAYKRKLCLMDMVRKKAATVCSEPGWNRIRRHTASSDDCCSANDGR
jgi:hypothetical protein